MSPPAKTTVSTKRDTASDLVAKPASSTTGAKVTRGRSKSTSQVKGRKSKKIHTPVDSDEDSEHDQSSEDEDSDEGYGSKSHESEGTSDSGKDRASTSDQGDEAQENDAASGMNEGSDPASMLPNKSSTVPIVSDKRADPSPEPSRADLEDTSAQKPSAMANTTADKNDNSDQNQEQLIHSYKLQLSELEKQFGSREKKLAELQRTNAAYEVTVRTGTIELKAMKADLRELFCKKNQEVAKMDLKIDVKKGKISEKNEKVEHLRAETTEIHLACEILQDEINGIAEEQERLERKLERIEQEKELASEFQDPALRELARKFRFGQNVKSEGSEDCDAEHFFKHESSPSVADKGITTRTPNTSNGKSIETEPEIDSEGKLKEAFTLEEYLKSEKAAARYEELKKMLTGSKKRSSNNVIKQEEDGQIRKQAKINKYLK